VSVHLAPEDPRLSDLERNVLDKLDRVMPKLDVRVLGAGGAFTVQHSTVQHSAVQNSAAQDADRYGLIEFDLARPDGTRHAETRSTSPREILPLIFDLADVKPTSDASAVTYPGYPLIADARAANGWFFLVLPALIALMGWRWGRS
jgi:hypothetical protein